MCIGGRDVNTGASVSAVQVNTCVHVDELPQLSVAVYVLVCVFEHPVDVAAPREEVMFGVPQLSLAVAVPAAGTPVGLHPSAEPAGHDVNTGASVSAVQVNTCVQVDELLHASVAVYVLVCELEHPVDVAAPREEVMFGVPQLSVAIAVPAEGNPVGLHPSAKPAGHDVNTGASVSAVQVNTCVQVDELPQLSVAVYVLVCVFEHPVDVAAPREEVMFGVPQLSLAVAVPAAGTPVGLHPSAEPAGHDVNTGASVSAVQVNVCVQVDELLHASVAAVSYTHLRAHETP